MDSKRKRWFSVYYLIILILCLLIGLFIWFVFQANLAMLEQEKENAYKKKPISSLQRVSNIIK